MIVTPLDGALRYVTQSDHARFAAQLLELWRGPEVADHPRREALLVATREHDVGWQGVDAAPRVDPETGRPHDFLSLPEAERIELWRRGVTRWPARDPWVGLLVLQHAIALHRDRSGGAWDATLAAWRTERDRLLEASGHDRAELDADHAWLALADTLSLVGCRGIAAPLTVRGVRAALADGALALDPFPLAGATTFEIACRWIEERPYASDSELALALASSRWTSFSVRVVPPASGG